MAPSHLLPAPISASWVSPALVWAPWDTNSRPGFSSCGALASHCSPCSSARHPQFPLPAGPRPTHPAPPAPPSSIAGGVGERDVYTDRAVNSMHVPSVFITGRRPQWASDRSCGSLLLLDFTGRLCGCCLGAAGPVCVCGC